MLRLPENMSSKKDEELLADYRQTSDMAIMAVLYDRYISLVYGVCLKYLKNEFDAKDSVMQIFEELTEKVLRYDIQLFKSWLYVLSKNHCLMRLRKESKNKGLTIGENFMEIEPEFHLDKEMENAHKINALNECIAALPPQQKEVVIKFFMEEHSYKEVCDITGYDLNKVKSCVQNGKRNLKICLENKHIITA